MKDFFLNFYLFKMMIRFDIILIVYHLFKRYSLIY